MPRVLGLYDDQHSEVGRLVRDARVRRRGRQGVAEQDRTYQPPIRCIAMIDREYTPKTPAACPIFGYFPNRTIFVVEQIGSALGGYLALIVNGKRWIVECRRENLDDVQSYHRGVRITVLPGLWEFDFGELTDAQASLVSVEVEPITSDENLSLCELFDDTESVIYTGSTIVIEEAWATFPNPSAESAPKVISREITDCIPYRTGSVKRGAIGLGIWSWDAGYLVNAWQCRTFSHATGYVQADDPALIPVTEDPPPDPQPDPNEDPPTEEEEEESPP